MQSNMLEMCVTIRILFDFTIVEKVSSVVKAERKKYQYTKKRSSK